MEGLLLLCGSTFGIASKNGFYEIGVGILGIMYIVGQGMYISTSVNERRVEETNIRYTYDPVLNADTDTVLIRTITKSRFGEVHRTDCTQKVCIDFLGFINLEVIIGLGDDIIGIMEDQNQIVAYVIITLNDHVIEVFQKFGIAQSAFTQSKEILLFASLFFFLFGKVQFQQVVANRTGERLFGNIQIFIEFFILKIQESFI